MEGGTSRASYAHVGAHGETSLKGTFTLLKTVQLPPQKEGVMVVDEHQDARSTSEPGSPQAQRSVAVLGPPPPLPRAARPKIILVSQETPEPRFPTLRPRQVICIGILEVGL